MDMTWTTWITSWREPEPETSPPIVPVGPMPPVEKILLMIRAGIPEAKVQGHWVHLTSARLRMFAAKGTWCVICGLEATHFQLDWKGDSLRPHLGLYAGDVLITKDHIVAKSRGGRDTLSNLQPMCSPCNAAKGAS